MRTITVTAVGDGVPEGPHLSFITHTIVSADPAFSGTPVQAANSAGRPMMMEQTAMRIVVADGMAGADLPSGSPSDSLLEPPPHQTDIGGVCFPLASASKPAPFSANAVQPQTAGRTTYPVYGPKQLVSPETIDMVFGSPSYPLPQSKDPQQEPFGVCFPQARILQPVQGSANTTQVPTTNLTPSLVYGPKRLITPKTIDIVFGDPENEYDLFTDSLSQLADGELSVNGPRLLSI